jgi:hypothetical protein
VIVWLKRSFWTVCATTGQDGEGGEGSQEFLRDNNINAKADKKKGKGEISTASDSEASDALAQAQKAAKEDEREPLQVRSYTEKVHAQLVLASLHCYRRSWHSG